MTNDGDVRWSVGACVALVFAVILSLIFILRMRERGMLTAGDIGVFWLAVALWMTAALLWIARRG